MATCLGLYIENNIIKYAKVSKERDQMKVESYGVRCFDDINKAIKQVIEETDSYKVPVCVNLSEEIYNFFYVFALLNKNDIPKAIKTEFESYCASKNYNPNAFETRYAITPMAEDKEKLRVIHISANKIELNKRIQEFGSYKLQKLIPVSMTIPNITKFEPKERALIVNIEEKTTVTTIYNQNIYDIKILDIGSQDILNKISAKENSYQKAYEICKETTIYTSESNNISEEDKYYFRDFKLTDDEFVITDANFNVSQEFNLNVKNAGNFLNIYVNNILVTTCNQLYNTVAVVDDLIIMAIKNNQIRTTKVIAVDINGNIIKEFYNIGDSDGLVTLEQGNSFIVNSSSFVLITSRVIDTNLILSNEYGELDGIDICNKEELNKLNLEDNMLVMANFLIKYEGNHKFSSPTKIGDIKLKEYIDINKYCK